jgi:phage baseplate assembly protein W
MTDFTRQVSGFRFVQTEYGDTLQSVALRELGDARQWSTLAWFNKLIPPYLTDDASQSRAGVLICGATIRVPSASAEVDAGVFPDEVFLSDCKIDKGALQFAAGDFALVSGRENLHQAISNRIVTDHGDLIFHGDYGANLHRIIGLSGPVQELVAAEYVDDALRAENRIQTVSRVTATTQGDRLSIEAEVVPITGANINVLKVV